MSIIDRYIRREITKLFLPMLGLLATIFIGFTASALLKDAVAGAILSTTAPKLILLNTLIALEVLLPTTLFFASIAVLIRMQNDYETLAILATGITPLHLTFTVMKLALLVAVGVALISIFARPWAYKLSYQLESEVMTKLDVNALMPRQFIDLSASGQILYAKSVDRKNGHLNQVFMQRKATATNPSKVLISAAQAQLLPLNLDAGPVMQFTNGNLYRLDPDGRQDIALKFNRLQIQLPEEEKLTEYRRNAVPTATLAGSDQIKDIAEYQWRLVTPLLTLLLAALAVPMTMTPPRQSRTVSIAAAILIYALVFGFTSVIRTGVEQGQIAALPGMWLVPIFTALLLATMALVAQYHNRLFAH